MHPPARSEKGFTLLEVMIAMSILAVGAASILGTFVAAVRWQSLRVENNQITAIYNHARLHAAIKFNEFDPSKVEAGKRPLPPRLVVDLTDQDAAMRHPDPQVREGGRKFVGFKYEIDFEENDFAVEGSSVVVNIKIYGLSGQLADSPLRMKEIITRSGTPTHEWWASPSKGQQDKLRKDMKKESNR